MEKKGGFKNPVYDDSTVASNPGQLRLNPIQWIKTNFKAVFLNTFWLLLGFYLMLKVHWALGIIFIAALLYNIWYWLSTMAKFKSGDVNPGKVLSLNPDRVAVATDMTKFGGNYPILKIFETSLPKFEKEVGLFIPTVALYNDNPFGYPFWSEFHPVPISHGTSDKSNLQKRFNTFQKEDFEELERFILQVNSIEKGTYKIDVENSNWKDFPDVEVGSLSKMKGPKKQD